MKMIISPAKTMIDESEVDIELSIPLFNNIKEKIKQKLLTMSFQEIKSIWNCNDKIAQLNYERLYNKQLPTPAIYSYYGIQYKNISPISLDNDSLNYLNNHLLIISGYYGLLRAFDGIEPYRLEFQAKLSIDNFNNLYDFWGDKLAESIDQENEIIINLASDEYAKAIIPHLKKAKIINISFNEYRNNKYLVKATALKAARGAFVRYCAINKINDYQKLKYFNMLNYQFNDQLSDEHNYIFTLK
ncbi:MAG: peroxide stress protein YaaA [Erysipelotrichaceae bacterium]|nr:peroxide stress protein YaaA [Erysipelotrichaceae bacterium]